MMGGPCEVFGGGPCAGRGIEKGPDMTVSQSREPRRNFPGNLFNFHVDYDYSWDGLKKLVGKEQGLARIFSQVSGLTY